MGGISSAGRSCPSPAASHVVPFSRGTISGFAKTKVFSVPKPFQPQETPSGPSDGLDAMGFFSVALIICAQKRNLGHELSFSRSGFSLEWVLGDEKICVCPCLRIKRPRRGAHLLTKEDKYFATVLRDTLIIERSFWKGNY